MAQETEDWRNDYIKGLQDRLREAHVGLKEAELIFSRLMWYGAMLTENDRAVINDWLSKYKRK